MIPAIILLFGLTMLYVSATSRIEAYIRALCAQGLLLFLLVLFDFSVDHLANMIFLGVETLLVKAIIVPYILLTVVRKNDIVREIDPRIHNFFFLLINTVVLAIGFYISYWSSESGSAIRGLYFGISISTIISGFCIIIFRKKIITHVIGYMLIENGIFLLAMSIAREMPLIVSLGVLLDVFIAVYIFGLFVNKIRDVFIEIDIDTISRLKD